MPFARAKSRAHSTSNRRFARLMKQLPTFRDHAAVIMLAAAIDASNGAYE